MFLNNQEEVLPVLKEDLKLLEASPAEDGTKQWMIFNPVSNRYYTIGKDSFELISKWKSGEKVKDFIEYLKNNDYEIEEQDMLLFINFLKNNNLVKNYTFADVKKLSMQKKQSKQSFFKWLIHNYLFIRIPIFKPDKILSKYYNKISFLYSRMWTNIVLILGFLGILMVLRQWEDFSTTFMYLFSREGMIYYILSLIFVKSLHELGHAFTAKRYGCKIPSMGVAFLVMFPVLYTDTTNSYAIKSKYKRLRIVLAGMKVELYLALIATFLWSFIPDGALRSIVFIIATTSWITSLLINISPFMRFDGYYALSDWTNTKNLQPRSFATSKWFLRKYLLGVEETPPETLTKTRKRFFIIYAICTWVYRFFLFFGIAVLVYHFAFKALGIILFLVEIFWFVLIPIINELKIWWKMREKLSWNRQNKISFSIFIFILLFLIFPWNSKVHMPAVIEAEKLAEIYASKPSFIKKIYIKDGQEVKKDEILLSLESENLEYRIKYTKEELNLLKHEVDQIAANSKNLENRFIIEENILKKEEELKGLLKTKDELIIKAPFDGVVQFNDTFRENQWVTPKEAILNIYNNKSSKIIGFCKDRDLKSIIPNAKGKFIANNGQLKNFETKVETISNISLSNLDYKELSSIYKGNIATRESKDAKGNTNLISEEAYFKIESKIINSEDTKELRNRIDGELIVQAESSSIIKKAFLFAYNILIKESSF